MKLENFVSNMMRLNNQSRLWHWGTSSAQHHITYEKFLTENELLTDSFVESVLGNGIDFKTNEIEATFSIKKGYSLEDSKGEISDYRNSVRKLQSVFENSGEAYQTELSGILDDVAELCSKTLYLLSLK